MCVRKISEHMNTRPLKPGVLKPRTTREASG
jgi:hypothetical protein